MNSAPAIELAKPKARMIFAPKRSFSLPETGAPMPENSPRKITRYPPEPAGSRRQFSENCGTKMTPIITKPLIMLAADPLQIFSDDQ